MSRKFKPLGPYVLVKPVKPVDNIRGIEIPDSAQEKIPEGRVVAIGTGRVREDGGVTPITLKVGDVVMFSMYAGTELTIDGEKYLNLDEAQVHGIWEEEPDDSEDLKLADGEDPLDEILEYPEIRSLRLKYGSEIVDEAIKNVRALEASSAVRTVTAEKAKQDFLSALIFEAAELERKAGGPSGPVKHVFDPSAEEDANKYRKGGEGGIPTHGTGS